MWLFRTGGQQREMPKGTGALPTVSNRFRQWRDVGVFEALLEGLIADAAKRGDGQYRLHQARAHHAAADADPERGGCDDASGAVGSSA